LLELITPFTYWILTALWLVILGFYLVKLRHSRAAGGAVAVLLTLLAIDAFRTLFESVYFGFYFNSMFGLLPYGIYELLSQPSILIIPKLINIFAGFTILFLLIRRWIPQEAKLRDELIGNLQESETLTKQAQAEFTAIFNAISDAVVFVDPQRRIVRINPAFTRIFGYQIEEIKGKTTKLIYDNPDDYHEQGKRRYNRDVITTGEGALYDNTYRRKDGIAFPGETLGEKVTDEHGELLGFLGVIRDVSERVKSRKALEDKVLEYASSQKSLKESELRYRKSEATLQAAMDQSPAGIAIADVPDGTLRYINNAGLSISGATRDKIVPGVDLDHIITGWNVFDLEGRSLDRDQIPLIRAVKYGEYSRKEIIVRRAENDECIVDANAAPIVEDDGHIQSAIVVFTDVTENKNLEEERRRLTESLKLKNAELERFVYTASHDLKTPLVTISGFAGILKHALGESCDETVLSSLNHIDSATEKMNQLLNDLLLYSRTGHLPLNNETVGLNELTQEVMSEVKPLLTEGQIRYEIARNMPEILGDRSQLHQVMQNLIVNAIKYMGKQPEPFIEIGIDFFNDQQAYYVRDNGIGIDPQYQSSVFGLFKRLSTDDKGTGVGLALVKQIVERHGGDVWIESSGEAGKGTSIWFTLKGDVNTVDSE
jgi:PAS domain S-box-containing protein